MHRWPKTSAAFIVGGEAFNNKRTVLADVHASGKEYDKCATEENKNDIYKYQVSLTAC